jgi:hypothetical protein
MKKIIFILITGIMLGSSVVSCKSAPSDDFSGIGDATTAPFTITNYLKFEWTTTYSSAQYALFSGYLYEQGDSIYKGTFDGLSGTSYYYDDGTFYFEVIAANLDSWTITTTELSQVEKATSFAGIGDCGTKCFDSPNGVKITWNTTYESEQFALFSAFTYQIGDSIYKDHFDELSFIEENAILILK